MCIFHCRYGWWSFIGGLVVAHFTTAVWRSALFDLLVRSASPWRAVVVAAVMYLVQIFYSVWTVAYNFVPGGTLTREFSSLQIGVMMASFAWVFWTNRRAMPIGEARETRNRHGKVLLMLVFIGAAAM